MPYWCGECRKNFSVRTNSIMEENQDRLSEVGNRIVSIRDKFERRIQYEASQRFEYHSEVRMVHVA